MHERSNPLPKKGQTVLVQMPTHDGKIEVRCEVIYSDLQRCEIRYPAGQCRDIREVEWRWA